MSVTSNGSVERKPNNFLEDDRFWKILHRNMGKTILMEFPDMWVQITVTEHGNVTPTIGNTLQDLKIPRKAFTESLKSKNLKLALSDVFNNRRIRRALVLKNKNIRKHREQNKEAHS